MQVNIQTQLHIALQTAAQVRPENPWRLDALSFRPSPVAPGLAV